MFGSTQSDNYLQPESSSGTTIGDRIGE